MMEKTFFIVGAVLAILIGAGLASMRVQGGGAFLVPSFDPADEPGDAWDSEPDQQTGIFGHDRIC